jgi:hypothetical protein
MGERSRWTAWWTGWRLWATAAVLAATSTYAIDRVRIALVSRGPSGLTLLHEWTLWSGHAVLALLVLLLGTLAWSARAIVPARRRDGWLGSVIVPSVVGVLALALPLHWVGEQLASGAWIAEQWFAPLVARGPLGAALVALPIGVVIARRTGVPSRRERLVTATLAGALLVLAVADHKVGAGIYPPFHMTVHVLMSAVAMIAVARLLVAKPRIFDHPRAVAAVIVLTFVAAPLSWATMSGPTRSALVLRSAVARDWIRNAMPQRPKTLLRDMLAAVDVQAGAYAPSEIVAPPVEFAGRGRHNIVLVVVDTLRGDALPPARPDDGMPFVLPGDTPRMDAWLDGAYRFRHAYSTSTKTHRAMPTMFRSIRAGDDPLNSGVPLGRRMEALGLRPGASVNTFFIAQKFPQIAALMDGFGEDVEVYEKLDTPLAVPNALELVRSFGGQQFFVWLHMYNVHDPGFDGELLGAKDGNRVERYRRSLKYLDAQFGALLDGLEEQGVLDETIIVLTSDHGEGLGDHGQMLHGPNVFDEDIGVPLAFSIPGTPGRVIDETVGTIDLAPTLVDLLGAPADPNDRGRTLVPLFVSEPQQPARPYFFEAADNDTVGVIIGKDKLIYESEIDVAHRFDVGADPDENSDLFEPDGQIDAKLLQTLVEYRPMIVADELKDDAVVDLLRDRLAEVDATAPGAALPLLVQLVALQPERDLVRRCAKLFEDGGSDVRLLIARHLLGRAPKTITPRMVKWFADVADTPAELELVTDLSRQGQGAFSTAMIAERMGHYARTGAPETWEPWLRLVMPWPKRSAEFVPPLAAMLERWSGGADVPQTVLELVLIDAASIDDKPKGKGKSKAKPEPAASADMRPALLQAARKLMAHEDPRIRTAAVRVLGVFEDHDAIDLARERMLDRNEDLRVRRESATTFTALAGAAAIDDLIELSDDREMTTFAVRNLKSIGTAEVVPFLRKIAKEHYNNYLRREARKGADAIEKKLGKTKPKPKPKARAAPAQPPDSGT